MGASKEEWKPVVGFPEYEISNRGRFRSVARIQVRKDRWGTERQYPVRQRVLATVLILNRCGTPYEKACVSVDGRRYSRFVHRLVAEAFHPNHAAKAHVNHIDGNTLNNSASNLEWSTQSENIKHSYEVLGRSKFGRCVLVGGVKYESVAEAARQLGVSYSHMHKVSRGIKKTVKGMKVSYG